MKRNKKIIAFLPAYNAEKTLEQVVKEVKKVHAGWIDKIILIDDKSSDSTLLLAKKLGLTTFGHKKNTGYGGNQKSGYKLALNLGADIVAMIHADNQYDPAYIPQIVEPLINEECDAVFGSRMTNKKDALKGGMPYWKYLGNIFLTKLINFFLKLKLTECHSGFRAYSQKALRTIPLHLNSDDFVFDTEIIIQLHLWGFKIKEIPIPTRYFKEASSINFLESLKYGFEILKALLQFKLVRWKIIRIPKFQKYDSQKPVKNNY